MDILELQNEIILNLQQIQENNPLIHNITNYVTVNDCANVLLAIGASPIMADDEDEVEEITQIANALVINLGTLNKRTISSMLLSGKKANELGIPVILDPVGVGVSTLRNNAVKDLFEQVKFNVIRGNLSELSYIAGYDTKAKGVDVSQKDQSIDASIVVHKVANMYHCVAAITGAIDVISDGTSIIRLANGHPMLSKITGTGCMTTALIGGYLGASKNPLVSTVAGILTMSIAGEIAYKKYGEVGTGSFHVGIVDAISKIDKQILCERWKIIM